jgi:hypothetical protein
MAVVNCSSFEKVDIKLSLRALQVVLPRFSPLKGPSHVHFACVALPVIGSQ